MLTRTWRHLWSWKQATNGKESNPRPQERTLLTPPPFRDVVIRPKVPALILRFLGPPAREKKLVCNYFDEASKTNELKNFDSEDLFERREPASKSKLWRIGPARTILEQTWNFSELNQQNVSLSRSVWNAQLEFLCLQDFKRGLIISRPCHIGNTSSHSTLRLSNIAPGKFLDGRPLGNSRRYWQKPKAKQKGGKIFQGIQALGTC